MAFGKRIIRAWLLAWVVLLYPALALAGQVVELDSMQQQRLNVFLSNFSEVLLPPFSRGNITDQQLIRFGLLHTWANNPGNISRSIGIESISAEVVDCVAEKYFGRKVLQHQAAAPDNDYQFTYQDGLYYRAPSFFPDFAGRRFAVVIYFTQISALIDEGGDCYTAFGDMYVKEPQSVDFHSLYWPLAEWDKRMLPDIQKVRQIKATIKLIKEDDGSARYILLDYCYQ